MNNSYLSHLRFTDEIVILSETANKFQDMLRSLAQASATKTNIMTNMTNKLKTAHQCKREICRISPQLHLPRQTIIFENEQ